MSVSGSCASIRLPAGGVISLPNGTQITLGAMAAFRPVCVRAAPAIVGSGSSVTTGDAAADNPSTISPQASDFRDPFYASTFPQCYALAATTVIAYLLVIMLFITPRSFLDGGIVVLGRRGFTNGGTGVNIGGRPWLQKVATLTVAISLTIATVDTFREAEEQYAFGIENAVQMQAVVLGGTELKVIRIISGTFLWLAQAQTLIRLFPRHREKVIIKWTAFALITLDVIFQCLDSFQYTSQGATRPRNFTDAVPALSYLFELSLGVLYAAWVIYYSLIKKRYAFYHAKMRNMCLLASLSVTAILVPIIFFILDVSKPDFTGWGDYVRWVGAAAASVIVWEWVERIEALEREEKKDGILGREVYDGDEMMEMGDSHWPRRKGRRDSDGGGTRQGTNNEKTLSPERGIWPSASSIVSRYRSRSRPEGGSGGQEEFGNDARETNNDRPHFLQPPLWPARPAPTATPISRTDTASAASTVYAVRYHALTESTSRTTPPPNHAMTCLTRSDSVSSGHQSDTLDDVGQPPVSQSAQTSQAGQSGADAGQEKSKTGYRLRGLGNGITLPKLRRGEGGPSDGPSSHDPRHHGEAGRWDIKSRLEDFAATQAEKLREKVKPTPDTASLPVRVIPAPPRPGAALAQLREEEEQQLREEPATFNELPQRTNSDASASASASGSGSSQLQTPTTWQSLHERPHYSRTPPAVRDVPAPPKCEAERRRPP